jgi:hypothetical protein
MADGNEELAELARRAARTLLARRHASGLIQAWGDLTDTLAAGSSTIDTMMNLPLLWWADRRGVVGAGPAATRHAELTAELYVRADGTTFHRAADRCRRPGRGARHLPRLLRPVLLVARAALGSARVRRRRKGLNIELLPLHAKVWDGLARRCRKATVL